MSTDLKRFGRLVRTGLVTLVLWGSASAEMRTWGTRDGRFFDAEYDRQVLGSVVFKDANRKTISVKFEDLSAAHQRYIRTMVAPEITINYSKHIEEMKKPELWTKAIYQRDDDYTFIVTTDVTFTKRSKAPFDGSLTAELYLVGLEQATPDYVLFGKAVDKNVHFTEESKGRYVMRATANVRNYYEYNRTYRGAKYEGYAVVVLDPRGKVSAFKSDLAWLDEESIDSLRQLRVKDFFNEKCKKVRTPRPKYYPDRFIWR